MCERVVCDRGVCVCDNVVCKRVVCVCVTKLRVTMLYYCKSPVP